MSHWPNEEKISWDQQNFAGLEIKNVGKNTGSAIKKYTWLRPCNPALPNIPQVISSHLDILRSSQRCLQTFSSSPRISYRRSKNLRDMLVRAKHRRQDSPLGFGSFPLSQKIGARRVLSLQGEPRLTLYSLPTNKDA